MSAITFTHWTDVHGKSRTQRTMTWADFCAWVAGLPPQAVKTSSPLVKLATFGDARTEKGALRHDDNVSEVFGIEGDYDGEVVTPDEAIARLERAGLRALVVTTHTHTPEKPRWRGFAPLSAPVPPSERRRLTGRLNGALYGIFARESFTLSQSYFVGGKPGSEYRTINTFDDPDDGLCIDQADTLDALAKFPDDTTASKAPTAPGAADAVFVPPETLRDLRSALTALRADDRGLWVSVGHELKTIGEPGRALWLEWSQTSEKYDPADAAQKWETFKPTATSYQSVFAKAQRAGWLNPMSSAGHAQTAPAADQGGIDLTPITLDELHRAQLSPREILPHMLYADVRTRLAAGGIGKTTIATFEAVTLALGRELWGRMPERPMRTVIVTREDGREILVARLREIAYSMRLGAGELDQVLRNVQIIDLTSFPFRLSRVVEDVVYPHSENLDQLTSKLQAWAPDWLIFDPLVSFGVGESRVNDAEQGLIEAFRIMRNRLDCCIEGIHHTGKVSAQEKRLDQYAGRGGSALSDGCRMVCVMQPLSPAEWRQATGTDLQAGESGIVMALPKLSYSKPQEPVFIRRTGYRFTMETPNRRTPEQAADAIANQVEQFIRYEYEQGRRYSTADLENSRDRMSLSRPELRAAITALKVSGRVIYHHVNGKAGSHYEPVTVAKPSGDGSAEISERHANDDETVAA
jgi:hypothetical protein